MTTAEAVAFLKDKAESYWRDAKTMETDADLRDFAVAYKTVAAGVCESDGRVTYTDAELGALRETTKSQRFYAERDGTVVPGIVRLVERLDAAEAELEASRALIRVVKRIDLDLHTSLGSELETAFMEYDAAMGLKPDEVAS